MASQPFTAFDVVIERLTIAVLVFRDDRIVYRNPAAVGLVDRLRQAYHIELEVMLRDHLAAFRDASARSGASRSQPTITLITADNGEPLYVHMIPVGNEQHDVAVVVRRPGTEFDAFRARYRLSPRESQIAELVLHGYRNCEIASALGITLGTTKKHLTHVFDKVGVDTRNQLLARLA
jgi:DNA-binding CsgD family transcriptional regulator